MQNDTQLKAQLDKDKEVRKKFFLYASELYYKINNDSSAEIQLLINQRRYLSYVTKDKPHYDFGPGGDYYPSPATCAYFEKVFKHFQYVKQVKAVNVESPSLTEWRIVLVYKGDKILGEEAKENLDEYGPTGSKSLRQVSAPLLPSAIHTDFWSKASCADTEEEKKPAAKDDNTALYTSAVKSQP